MTHPLEGRTWLQDRAGEALEAFSRLARLPNASHAPARGARVEDAARLFGLDAERLSIRYGELDAVLTEGAPALLQVGASDDPRLVVLVGASRTRARILTPDSVVHVVSIHALRDALLLDVERTRGKAVDTVLEHIPMAPKRRARARAALLREQVAAVAFDAGWSLRVSPAAPFREQLRRSGVTRTLVSLTLAHAGGFLLSIAAWWLVGRGALAGHLDRGWLYGWALLLATLIPIRVMTAWWQGTASIVAGVLLKRRMFLGALELHPSEVRHEGAGQLLGRVMEMDALEELAMHGGFVSLVALVELALSIPVLGLSGFAPVGAFLSWMAFAVWLVLRFAAGWLEWSRTRIAMTNETIEGMLGHRTRLAHESPEDWHDAEDRALATYSEQANALDRTSTLIAGALPRGWLLLGLASIAPVHAANSASPEMLAVSIGGVLLARNALVRVTAGMTSLVSAYASWRHAAPVFRAEVPVVSGPSASAPTSGVSDATLLDVRHVTFHYGDTARSPALRDVTVRLRGGDRVLVQGPSGSGKSTLGALMAGLLRPTGGLVLLHGLDRASLGAEAWRRHIAAAPQFHENHLLSETLAFNLLMSRQWPPRREDLLEAESVCRELGLGPLLERMPGGLMQRVGETGWQLSHGERSRVYLARALLQAAELVILDESFASLDPATQKQALECAMKRSPTLIVIAHP